MFFTCNSFGSTSFAHGLQSFFVPNHLSTWEMSRMIWNRFPWPPCKFFLINQFLFLCLYSLHVLLCCLLMCYSHNLQSLCCNIWFHGIGMFEVVTYVDVLKYVRTASKQMQKSWKKNCKACDSRSGYFYLSSWSSLKCSRLERVMWHMKWVEWMQCYCGIPDRWCCSMLPIWWLITDA